MGIEEPKMPTPEEMAKIQKERALSDAELINEGAEYVVDEKGVRLEVEYEQIEGAKKEMKKEKEESPKIELPKDFERIEKLEIKLEEYKRRLQDKKAKIKDSPELEWKAPEQVFPMLAGTIYKIAIGEKLLSEGEVKTYELSQELSKKYGTFVPRAFNKACTVIEDYCKTGGKNVRGGTGF